jgi:hypothetical protein
MWDEGAEWAANMLRMGERGGLNTHRRNAPAIRTGEAAAVGAAHRKRHKPSPPEDAAMPTIWDIAMLVGLIGLTVVVTIRMLRSGH